jgi:hypothetical protein
MSGERTRNTTNTNGRVDHIDDAEDDDLPVVDVDVNKKEHIIKLRLLQAFTSLVQNWYWAILPFLLLTVFAYDICKLVHPAIRFAITCQQGSGWTTNYGVFNSTVKYTCLAAEIANAVLLVLVWLVALISPVIIVIVLAQLAYISNLDLKLDRKRYLLRARRRQEEVAEEARKRRARVKKLREKLLQEQLLEDEEEAERGRRRKAKHADSHSPSRKAHDVLNDYNNSSGVQTIR